MYLYGGSSHEMATSRSNGGDKSVTSRSDSRPELGPNTRNVCCGLMAVHYGGFSYATCICNG